MIPVKSRGDGASVKSAMNNKKGRRQDELKSRVRLTPEFRAARRKIPKHERAKDALKVDEGLYRLLFKNSGDAILLTQPDGQITEANPEACRMFGRSEEEIKKIGRAGIVDSKDSRLSAAIEKGRRTGQFKGELNHVKKDGVVFPCDVTAKRFKDSSGNEKTVLIIRDLTERKRAESQREAALDALAQQNDASSKLNRFAIELSMLPPKDNLEVFISKRIKEMTGAVVAIFSEYNPESRTTTARHIEMQPRLLGKVVGLLGKQVEKIHSPVSDEMYREITTEIVGMRRTLYEASFGAVSRPVGAAIQAWLKVDRFIGIAYLIKGKLYGTSLLGMSKDQPDPSKQILENFSFLAALSLRRKQAEEELKKSSQLLRDTGEMAKVGGWELDLSTKEVSWTEEVARIHGVEPGYKPKLEDAINFYASESRPALEAALKKAAEKGEPYDLESLFIPSGSKDKIWVRSLGKAVYGGGKIVKLAGTFQNIDKYKQAEEALRKSESNLRALTLDLSRSGESERQRLALFLHDEIGQSLALLRMMFGSLAGASKLKSEKHNIQRIRNLLDKAIDQTHALTFELSPPVLYQLGLEAAVEWAGEKISHDRGIEFTFSDDGMMKPLDVDLKALLFRCIRELMMNIVKHAKARRMTVSLTRKAEMIFVVVEDDGIGFDMSLLERHRDLPGFGLFSVREHLAALGGSFHLQSEPGRGTCVALSVPLKEEKPSG